MNPDQELAALGRQIAALRKASGMTVSEVAARAGLSRNTVTDLANGRAKGCTLNTLCRVASAMGLSVVVRIIDPKAQPTEEGGA